METTIIVFFTVSMCAIILSVWLMMAHTDEGVPLFCVGASLFIVVMVLFIVRDSEPTAIDVYRKRTTLEITYKDGVPIDSVVVFK